MVASSAGTREVALRAITQLSAYQTMQDTDGRASVRPKDEKGMSGFFRFFARVDQRLLADFLERAAKTIGAARHVRLG